MPLVEARNKTSGNIHRPDYKGLKSTSDAVYNTSAPCNIHRPDYKGLKSKIFNYFGYIYRVTFIDLIIRD